MEEKLIIFISAKMLRKVNLKLFRFFGFETFFPENHVNSIESLFSLWVSIRMSSRRTHWNKMDWLRRKCLSQLRAFTLLKLTLHFLDKHLIWIVVNMGLNVKQAQRKV